MKNIYLIVVFSVFALIAGAAGFYFINKPVFDAVHYAKIFKCPSASNTKLDISSIKNPLFLKKFVIGEEDKKTGKISITGSWDKKMDSTLNTVSISCYRKENICVLSTMEISQEGNAMVSYNDPVILPIKYWNQAELVTMRGEGRNCMVSRLVISLNAKSVKLIEDTWDTNPRCSGVKSIKGQETKMVDGI